MHYTVAGILLGITAAFAQQDGTEASQALDWTVVIVAFLTGAFGSNGISKIIDSVWNVRNAHNMAGQLLEAKKLYEEAKEDEQACSEQVEKLNRRMDELQMKHAQEMARMREDLRNRL